MGTNHRLSSRLGGRGRLAAAIGLGLLVVGCTAVGAQPTPVGEQSIGRSSYEARCAPCHDKGVNNAPQIVGRAAQPERLEAKVRRGEDGHPAYGPSVLSDDQLSALVAYLRTGSTTPHAK